MKQADRRLAALRVLPLIDLTDLDKNSSPLAVAALSAKAITPYGPTAAICIWPHFVETAKSLLHGTGVRIAAAVNFPDGGTDIDGVLADTEKAIADGADEIDLVLPCRDFVENGVIISRQMIKSVRKLCGRNNRLKVIIEAGELGNDALIEAASEVALEEGAHFIKTSSGKAGINATPQAARIILETIREFRRGAGIKPAGGIHTLEDARYYLDLADEIMGEGWITPETFRFGASGLLDDVLAALGGNGRSAAPSVGH
ncbi:deoxyribose-phosphate aldolase [Phyllobacterium phragmitis]|uniref:Deoxyribose-phosphate aldolase n=1 Tax=Phyllobacterium phragmitis TaxID=2670329 RepID=A0A2S9IS05_9HYPH|nr:deoxyribose-phosphate aldolase [Phyllobacterium phragmitis]PRD43311.1 deoxyribose-phosphate aldolase [Phyllobacterium phragmitis]